MQKVISIKFSGLSKTPRKMDILALGHRDFFETFHMVSQAIAGSVKIGDGKVTFNPMAILQSLDFDTFEKIATKVLAFGVLDGIGTIENPFESDHFKNHPDELYSAVYAAVQAMNPGMFAPKKSEGTATKSAGDSAPQSEAGGE